jgi:ferredoxin
MRLDQEKCTQCGLCGQECPVQAIAIKKKDFPVFGSACVRCGLCVSVCPAEAISRPDAGDLRERAVGCDHCPVACEVPEGFLGACQRYRNEEGRLSPARPLVLPPPKELTELYRDALIRQPVITAIGAGGTYPDYKPAPLAAQKRVENLDVVTVVTESPLTYSSMLLKIDTDRPIGEETSVVKYRGAAVGHVTTEQYGSKMISLGGINVMKSKQRLKATRLIVGLANGEAAELSVEGGAKLRLQVGQPPVIDGRESEDMKIACGAAIMGMFGPRLHTLADEIIILDSDITGLFSESHVGHVFGFEWRGLKPRGRYGSPGRYFGTPGEGWGGSDVTDPSKAFDIVSPEKIRPGMKVLVLEVTGRQAALLEADEERRFHALPLPEEVKDVRDLIAENKEPSVTSAIYMGGSGGSARAGVTGNPIRLNRAVHKEEVRLSVGGVAAFVLPGGGINFMVDVGRMRWRPFSWTPAPAVVAPIEYTMERETYLRLGGHKQNLTLLEDIHKTWRVRKWNG